eukprot:3992319-Amphidinium_carterae.1
MVFESHIYRTEATWNRGVEEMTKHLLTRKQLDVTDKLKIVSKAMQHYVGPRLEELEASQLQQTSLTNDPSS